MQKKQSTLTCNSGLMLPDFKWQGPKITYSNLPFIPRAASHSQDMPTGLMLEVKETNATLNSKSRVAGVTDLPPLVKAIEVSAELNDTYFNLPGHKRGLAAPSELGEVTGIGPFLHDATELPELDSFFAPSGLFV